MDKTSFFDNNAVRKTLFVLGVGAIGIALPFVLILVFLAYLIQLIVENFPAYYKDAKEYIMVDLTLLITYLKKELWDHGK